MSDSDDEPIQFTLGEDRNWDGNESLTPNSSGTRGCKSFNFEFERISITLIDTPGIVDTGGVETDKKNLEHMLEFLSTFETIDAICILLKPNEIRLDAVFRYCFLELLSQLDQSAAQNILFVFTNARSSLYRPGSTAVNIKTLIADIKQKKPDLEINFSKENYFMIDSEGFNFLLAKDRLRFDADETETFRNSWDKSRRECLRLIQRVQSLPIHNVVNTLSIFRARQLIEALLPLLVEIGAHIITNEEECRKKEEEIQQFVGDISELQKILFIPRVELKVEHYDCPRIICKSEKCTQKLMVGSEMQNYYSQVCYEFDTPLLQKLRTYAEPSLSEAVTLVAKKMLENISGVTSISGAIFALGAGLTVGIGAVAAVKSFCWYQTGTCTVCSCENTNHVLTYYQTRQIESRIENCETREKILTKENEKEEKDKFIAELREQLEQLKYEKQVIDKANSTFAVFLKHRAITPYNDGYEAYLDMLIEQSKQEHKVEKRMRLEQQKNNYRDQKRAIDEGISFGAGFNCEITLQNVESVVAELIRLDRYGEQIKNVIAQKKSIDEMKKSSSDSRKVNLTTTGNSFFEKLVNEVD